MSGWGLVFQHACLWALPATCYGLLAGAVEVAGLDGTHWPDVLAAALWSGSAMFLLGAATGAISALPVAASAAIRGMVQKRGQAPHDNAFSMWLRSVGSEPVPVLEPCPIRPSTMPGRVACGLQSLLITSVGVWLYLNHQVTLKTDEAMTPGAVMFLFSNPKEVMDMVWRFEGAHFLGLCIAGLAGFCLLTWQLRRLNGSLLRINDPLHRTGRWPASLAGVLARFRPTRPIGLAMVVLFAVPAVLLAVQVSGYPSRSLITTAQVFPPLRAIQMSRWLTGAVVTVESPPPQGKPIVSLKEYTRRAHVDRSRLRNVVLVLLESVPAKALHCYGYPREVSPNLDRLAAEGVQFDHAYAAASFSSYSQISTFTSLYMLRDDENDHFRDIDFPHVCLHDVLRALGYELTVFSSGNEAWDNLEAFYPPETFDVYFSHNQCTVKKTDCNRMDDTYAMGELAKFIHSRRRDRPFFGYINLQGTHFNYEVPEPWASTYKPVPPLYSNGDGIIHIPAGVVPLLKNQYDNALTYVDHWVGFIRDQLERAGELDRSIIVVTGDHGEAFMEHGLARHGMHLWNEMIHVPLVMYAPGLIEPRRVAQAVSQIDIAPTVTTLMGLPPHPAWQGVDVLAKDYDDLAHPVFSVLQLTRYQLGLVWGQLKYMADQNTRQEWLFDLASDPGETRNLIDAPQPHPQRDRMRRMLAQWRRYQLDYYADKARQKTHYIGMPDFKKGTGSEPDTHSSPRKDNMTARCLSPF